MATEILLGSGFDLLDHYSLSMRSQLPGKTPQPEPNFQVCQPLTMQEGLSSLSCDEIGGSPINAQGATGSPFVQLDSQELSQECNPRGRKRAKANEATEEKRERQAAKNRQTAKAFRHKMDGLKNYSESRVNVLKEWVKGLWEAVIDQTPLPREATSLGRLRRTQSAPGGLWHS